MIARRLGPLSRLAALASLAASVLLLAACDKVPLTAPTESTITIFATASSISATGSTDIVATVIESAGTAVQNGTVVTFTTTLGRIEPLEARTQNGKVTVKLTGDGRSGTATITAFSGGAVSEQLTLAIGSAAAETVTLRAEPGRLPPGGGSTQIIALVRDAAGNALPGASVAFSATAGNLSSGVVTTDGNGEARTTLTTTRETTVKAAVGSKTAEIPLSVDGTLVVAPVTVTPDPPIAGRSATFAVMVNVPPGGNLIQRVTINFGDGQSQSIAIPSAGGSTMVAHTYDSDGTFTVTVNATDTAGNTQTQQRVIAVQPAPPLTVTLSRNPSGALTVNQMVIFTAATTPPTGVTITRYEWDLGDGTTMSTSENSISHSYRTPTEKLVRVRAVASDGSAGTALLIVPVS